MKLQWSYSSLKMFAQCAKQYYHIKVAKDVPPTDSEATLYGKEMHKAAEDYIRDGTPLPPKFTFLQAFMDSVDKLPGEKFCELKLGIKRTEDGFVACDFDDPDYWWHGIADLVVIGGWKAYSMDYKTSKNAKYADTKQLDIIAAAIFMRFPHIMQVKSALAFVVSNEFIKKTHTVVYRSDYLSTFEADLDRLEAAYKLDKWHPQSSPLCKFCPVKTCEYNTNRPPTSFWRK